MSIASLSSCACRAHAGRRAVAAASARSVAVAVKLAFVPAAAVLAGAPAAAQPRAAAAPAAATEHVIVTGERVYPIVDTVAPAAADAVDTAELLRELPGASLNANGPLTGIAQYRGLYGDRVAITLDGLPLVTGGPNSMDAPLSYASPLLLEHLHLERGIASVSSTVESLGGHIGADYDRGEHGDGRAIKPSGRVLARYADNGGLGSVAARLVGANETHKVALLAQRDRADDLEFPGGRLAPTRLERDRYDISYAYRADGLEVRINGGRLETRDTGTPSLPMDIGWIETDLVGLEVAADVGRAAIEAAVGYSGVEHVMDNFSLRAPPATPAQHRSTFAEGRGFNFRIGSRWLLDTGEWRLGVDGRTAEHSAVISNPNAPAFRIVNFDEATRDIVGVYGQWNRALARLDIEAGVRVNRARTRSGDASATIPAMNPMSQMMAANAALLAERFNADNGTRTRTNVDAVVKIGRPFGEMRSVYVELGRKTRVPSYQELFLWLPLESTGGLADGRSYIGSPALDSEVSHEINLGASWHFGKAWIAPQAFYKDVDGYIQGIPSENETANAVATMMTGRPALEFANTDARLYGIDAAWGVYLTESLTLDGVLGLVRGKRTDVNDHLYRIAPPNARVALTYDAERWSATVESVLYAAQTRTSAYNQERPTPGYGVLNAAATWRFRDGLALHARVSNLLDKRYRDHLDGMNRAANTDVPVGERLFAPGRTLQVGIDVSW